MNSVTVVFRLFVLPQYCGTLLEQSLLMNRRRNDNEDMPKAKKFKAEPILEDSISMTGTQCGFVMSTDKWMFFFSMKCKAVNLV